MDIYLVRHGQTEGNLASRHQHPDTPLNDEGERQARFVGRVLQNYNVTHIFTSRQKRALVTAKFVGEIVGLTPDTSDLFVELHRPVYLVGERRVGWSTLKYMLLWYFGYAPASHHDGETYNDLIQRIIEAKKFISKLPIDSRVVIISHSAFITFFITHLHSTKPVGLLRASRILIKMIFMRNTSYIHVRYDGVNWYKF